MVESSNAIKYNSTMRFFFLLVLKRYFTLLSLLLLIAICSHSQPQPPDKSRDFYREIKQYDLRLLWHSDSIAAVGLGLKAAFPEPLGFIGDHFQRFYIHYLSVTRSKTSPYLYEVTGKTRVKNNICSFRGTITVIEASLYDRSREYGYKEGYVTCQVMLKEDSVHAGSGTIEGRLQTDFCIDSKNVVQYNTIESSTEDSYCNNQCVGTWTSYSTGARKKCNWGDFRIPESEGGGKLDIGAYVFAPADEYIAYGWEHFDIEDHWWSN